MDKEIIRTPYPKKEIWAKAIYTSRNQDIYFKHYLVSNLGRIKIIKPFATSTSSNGKIIKALGYENDYPRCNLFIKSKCYMHILVHRLVARSFLGPIPKKYQVNHKNLDKSINWITNLEYVTQSQNNFHSWKYGIIDISNFAKGIRNGQSRLNNYQVRLIKQISKKDYPRGIKIKIKKELSLKYGVSIHTINAIWWNKTWSHIHD